jgi:hypothetical protein
LGLGPHDHDRPDQETSVFYGRRSSKSCGWPATHRTGRKDADTVNVGSLYLVWVGSAHTHGYFHLWDTGTARTSVNLGV